MVNSTARLAFHYCRLNACKGRAGTLYLGSRLLVSNTILLPPNCGYATIARRSVKEQPVPVEGTVKGKVKVANMDSEISMFVMGLTCKNGTVSGVLG